MKLSTRLSMFFLGMLALVLIGFSATVYYVAPPYLYGKVDDELDVLMNTLTAAAEVEPNSVEWKPEERDVSLDHLLKKDGVQWMITDGAGFPVQHWPEGDPAEVLTRLHDQIDQETAELDTVTQQVDTKGRTWHVSAHRVVSLLGIFEPDSTKVYKDGTTYAFDELVITASISRDEAQATLIRLRWWLLGASVAIWLVVAVVGRWLCRRALAPVTEMATAAREMSATDFERRLPISRTGDEIEDLGTAFNDLLVRLQDSYERQRGFTGDASHQLRTPLTAILGQLEVAMRRERDAGEYRKVLQSVQRQAGNLHNIIESLLFLARADQESQIDNLQQIDLAEWAGQFVARQNGQADNRVRFEQRTPGPFLVDAQSVLLGQLVQNLLDNALKYSQSSALVSVWVARHADQVMLTVEDRGPGISKDDQLHVFEPFFRSSQVRNAGHTGHGLGLAVALRIATAHGGTLEVESEPGKGSRFSLRLPAVGAAAEKADLEPAV